MSRRRKKKRNESKESKKEPLVERLKEGIIHCLVKKNYQGDGYDKRGNLVHYCAFFILSLYSFRSLGLLNIFK